MNFILDTDICSAYLKGDKQVTNRFFQYADGCAISSVTVAELTTWRNRKLAPANRQASVDEFLTLIPSVVVDNPVAIECGRIRAGLLDQGIVVAVPDLLIASTAILNDLTLVTHNLKDFALIQNLDWMNP